MLLSMSFQSGSCSLANPPSRGEIATYEDALHMPVHTSSPATIMSVQSSRVTTLAGEYSVAGGSDGMGTLARFNQPYAVVLSHSGSFALVADYNGHTIRHVDVDSAMVTTLAGSYSSAGINDGAGTNALFNRPSSVALADFGRLAYVTDYATGLLRRIEVVSGRVRTLAGTGTSGTSIDGIGSKARFHNPVSVVASPDGRSLFVGDRGSHKVRKFDVASRAVTTVAGSGSAGSADGVGLAASFNGIWGMGLTPNGALLFVAETAHYIRQIEVATGTVTVLAGVYGSAGGCTQVSCIDGVGTNARFYGPRGLAVTGDAIFVADYTNHRIRRIALSTRVVTTVAGTDTAAGYRDGASDVSRFGTPVGIAATLDGLRVLVVDNTFHQLRQFSPRVRNVAHVHVHVHVRVLSLSLSASCSLSLSACVHALSPSCATEPDTNPVLALWPAGQ